MRGNGAWHLSLAPSTQPRDVLRELATQGRFRVERFEVAEPSLDDIFVTVVQQGHPAAGEGNHE